MGIRLSVLDLATTGDGVSPRDALLASAVVAKHAEKHGYLRYWFSEHHNMPRIVSSTPGILAGYIAANTDRIRVGSGGVMLPNWSPLAIAEQYGTLETLYPGRIDIGLGRAPGTDMDAVRALRRDPAASERFPQDVVELQKLLGPVEPGQKVQAVPGSNTNIPLYILGSSLFGARLAALLGLPYAFASHFAPAQLTNAISLYRREFTPSEQLQEPYAIASMNVFAAETTDAAEAIYMKSLLAVAKSLHSRMGSGEAESDAALLESPAGQHARHMMTYAAVGNREQIREQVSEFVEWAEIDEVMVAMNTPNLEARLKSYEILADAVADVEVTVPRPKVFEPGELSVVE